MSRILESRSNRSEVFCKIGALRNFVKFTGKHICQSLFFDKKGILAQVLCCEFCQFSKNTFAYRTPTVAASEESSKPLGTQRENNQDNLPKKLKLDLVSQKQSPRGALNKIWKKKMSGKKKKSKILLKDSNTDVFFLTLQYFSEHLFIEQLGMAASGQ